MSRLNRTWFRLWTMEDGATMAEYGLILFFIAAICIALVGAIGLNVLNMFNAIVNGF